MEFAAGVSVDRLRAAPVTDPYSRKETGADWERAARLTIDRAFVASASSAPVDGELRQQVDTRKALYCTPGADVRVHDRIESAGHTYTVTAVPEADSNPFTGWQPVQEVPLEEVLG